MSAMVKAECVLVRNGRVWQWVIERCPYCKKRHVHGGGSVIDNIPRTMLTHRSAHCGDPFREKASAGYVLVEKDAVDTSLKMT